MFTCAKIRNGSTYLSSHLTANDYYCEGENVVGCWIGKGSVELKIEGQSISAGDAAFEAIRRNLMPDGSGKLTPRSNKDKNSVRYFDFQCSAQKSVSIMAVTMKDRRLYEAHDRASLKAFAELERFAAFQTGMACAREAKISGNLCAAAFRHDASRSLDPQLHTHFVVANATFDYEKKRWRALDTCEMFRAIRYAGKVYQNELARECRSLGYSIENVRNEKGVIEGFEIAGVSKDIRERFSKRRAEVDAGIERFQKEKGRMPSAQEIHVIARETRNVKLHEITTPEVRSRQREQLTWNELDALEAVKQRADGNKSVSLNSAKDAIKRAVEHIFERESVVKGHKILAEALNRNLGFVDPDELRECMTDKSIIQLTKDAANPLLSAQWASRRGLKLERWTVSFVDQTRNSCDPLGKTENTNFDFKSDEQRRVVLDTLNNQDRVYAIRGRAGTGKTTCLSEIRKGLEAANRQVYYLAPTSSAVEVLKKDGFTNATTVSGFLTNRPKKLRDTVVIIDESSLQSNEMGAAVINAARNARILLVGDIRQHVSVEAGDFLRVLEQHSKLRCSELKDIRRQQVREYNDAVRSLSNGDAIGGMKQLDDLGWIENARGTYIEQAADEYIARTEDGTDLDQCIAISPTWAENHRFTDAIRRRLKERELLSEGVSIKVCNQLDWTKEQRGDFENYRAGMMLTFNAKTGTISRGETLEVERIDRNGLWVKGRQKPLNVKAYAKRFSVSLPRTIELSIGDKVLIRRNHHDTGLINGNVLTVDRINRDGSIETREGKHIPPEFRHFAHGYVVTSHKAQGRTHKYEVVASERLDAKAAYVALSRGIQKARLFTPDIKNLFDYLGKMTDRAAALDVLNKNRRNVIQETEEQAFERNIKNNLSAEAVAYAESIHYSADQDLDYEDDFSREDDSSYGDNSGYKDNSGYEDDSSREDDSSYGDNSGYKDDSGYGDNSGYENNSGYEDNSDYENNLSL